MKLSRSKSSIRIRSTSRHLTQSNSGLLKIDSLPNLRVLCQRISNETSPESSAILKTAAIYRSSKPDKIVEKDVVKFRQLSIKSIVDFRSKEEYLLTKDHNLIDAEYTLYKVCLPNNNYQPGESVTCEVISRASTLSNIDYTSVLYGEPSYKRRKKSVGSVGGHSTNHHNLNGEEDDEKRHYLINFFTLRYIKRLIYSLPWYLWLLAFLYIIYDVVTRNKFVNLRRLLVHKAVNKKGLFGQYVDLIELSQPSICAALKLISEPDNLPVLINCAYGKDRTGIISALILTCLGMPKSYVAAEYALSTEGLEPVRQLVYQDIVGKYELTEEFCNSETETMLKLLNYIEEKYTSVEGYMCHIGFSLEEQHRLKANVEAFRHMGYEDDNDDDDHKVTGVVSSKSETLSSHPKSD
ncbi:CAunnamed protein product [Biomphalaria glabrata]|nr:CAunnamed protein product [Biomphalaria glabrata]